MRSRGSSIILATGARKSLVLLWTAVLLCSLLLQYTALAAPQQALALNPSLFELDGNVTKETYTDWNTIHNGGGSAFASIFIDDPINGNGDKYFDGGNTKDTINIPSWAWTTVSQPQDKNDIQNAYAAAYRDDGHLVVFFGLDRYASNGDAQVGFWFLQNEFGLTGGPATGGFSGTHKEGDVLVQIDFQNGGADPVLRVYAWTGGALVLKETGGSCATAGSGATRCGIASTADTDPNWPFDDKFAGGTDNLIPAGGLVEGGIDLTALGLDDGCFASFVAETRSSQSPTSTLSDFANGSFALCSKPDIATHVQQDGQNVSTINKGESVTDHAVLTGESGTVKGSVKFFVCRDANAAPDCSTGGDQVGGAVALSGGEADSDAFTPTQLGYYCFRVAYVPADGSKYLADSHTNKTSECFRVIPADVKIHKTAGQASVSAGSDITFTLSWGNVGEGKATGVVISDDLPGKAGLDWSIQSSTGTGSTCSISGAVGSEVLTCNVGAIAGNTTTSGTVTLVSGTTAASCGVVDNTGSITSTNDGSGSSSASTTVNCPDVKVTKTPNNGSINAGETATFSIKVENIGAGTATGVSVSDNLPGAVHWTEDEADCSISGADGSQVLTCTVGTLAAGASKTYSVSAVTSGPTCGVLDNTATATATNEPSGVLANNSDDGSINVLCASIDIAKVADDASVSAGDDIGFTITVTSKGPGEAKGVVMSDTFPTDAGTSWTIDGGTGKDLCTVAADGLSFSCDFGDMAKDATFTVHLSSPTTKATVADSPVSNTASVTTTNDGSDTDTDQVVVLGASIDIAKVADDASVSAGDDIGFTITVTSKGPGEAKGVVMSDTFPTDAGTSWTIDGGTGKDLCTVAADGLSFSCDFGDMAKDATFTVHLSSPTTKATVADSPVSNTASVTTTNDGSDTDTDQVVVLGASIDIAKVADDASVSAGDDIGFTITVTSKGPGEAKGVVMSDTFPTDAGTSWTIDGGTGKDLCTVAADGLSFSCDFGDMAKDATFTVHLSSPTTKATVADSPVSNTASVTTTNDGSDTDTDQVVVLPPDIKVTKDADNSPISAGDIASYTIKIENIGQGTAYGVTLADTLPAGITWTTGSSSCSILDGKLACDFGTMLPGAIRTVAVSGETTAANCGSLPNLAAAAASNEPSNLLANNSDGATITVDCPAIVITKSAVDPQVNATDTIAFDIVVTNTGVGSAYGVTVADTLPANDGLGWSIDGANSDAGWTIENGVLKYGPATLAPGASVKVRITSETTPASCGTVDNTATVTYQGGKGSDDSSIVVLCPDVTISKTADNSPILAGDTASYTISVWNQGEGTAYDVVITDTVPAGIEWAVDNDACVIEGGELTCNVGTLAKGDDPFTVTLSGPTAAEDCGDLPNSASVSAVNEPEGNGGNNEDDATVTVQCASITLVKTAGAAADGDELLLEEPGDVVFTYLVTNTGTADLVDVALVDDNATPDSTGDDITVTCPSTTLAAGASMTCTATLPVTYGLRTNIATVTANPDLDPEAEVSATDDAVVRVPEPEVTPTPTPRPTPKLTPPPTSTLDVETPGSSGNGLLLVLLSIAGLMLAVGYLVPAPARARRRNRRG